MSGWLLVAWVVTAQAWDEVGEDAVPTGRSYEASERFVAGGLPGAVTVRTDPQALGRLAARTAAALRAADEPELRSGGALSELGVSLADVLRTLDFVARVASEDASADQQRLTDPEFLAANFAVHHWRPDTDAAARRKVVVTPEKIRLTKYLVYQVQGSPVRTEVYDTALYARPDDPAALRAYTRMDAYAGVFEPGGEAHGLVKPLVYLTRDGVNQALMQGTVEVALPDGSTRRFNVHVNNGRPWQSGIKDPNQQPRYWSFREVEGVLGVEDVPLEAHVAVAGDVYNLGLGKLVALVDDAGLLRLAVLADTGGAFQPNLFQLDWFAGAYPSHEAFARGTRHLPRRAHAMVLVARATE